MPVHLKTEKDEKQLPQVQQDSLFSILFEEKPRQEKLNLTNGAFEVKSGIAELTKGSCVFNIVLTR